MTPGPPSTPCGSGPRPQHPEHLGPCTVSLATALPEPPRSLRDSWKLFLPQGGAPEGLGEGRVKAKREPVSPPSERDFLVTCRAQ